jgi:hypothetical protein
MASTAESWPDFSRFDRLGVEPWPDNEKPDRPEVPDLNIRPIFRRE